MRYVVKVMGKEYEVFVEEVDEGVFEVVVNGKRCVVKVSRR